MIITDHWLIGGYIATGVTWIMAIAAIILVKVSEANQKNKPKVTKRTSLRRPSRQVN